MMRVAGRRHGPVLITIYDEGYLCCYHIAEPMSIWYYILGVYLQTNNSVSAPDHADIDDFTNLNMTCPPVPPIQQIWMNY